jgi:argininosuccinate lyase
MSVDKERLIESFTSRIFATDEAFKLVSQGIPFRDAYKHVDYNFQSYKKESPEDIIKKRHYKGTTGNLGIPNIKKRIDREMANTKAREKEFKDTINRLLKA